MVLKLTPCLHSHIENTVASKFMPQNTGNMMYVASLFAVSDEAGQTARSFHNISSSQ